VQPPPGHQQRSGDYGHERPQEAKEKKKTSPWLVGCLGLVGLVVLVGAIVIAADSGSEAPPSAPPEDTSPPITPVEPTPEPTPELVEYTFDGVGDTLTAPFDLRGGLVVLWLQHTGNSNFIVELLPTDGDYGELSVNIIGVYSGIRVHPVQTKALTALKPGTYRIEVSADGAWEIAISQPVFTEGKVLPYDFQGVGDGVTDVMVLDTGIIPVSLSHTGSSNFIVQAFSVDGSNMELLVNEIGAYEGTVALRVRSGALTGLEPGLYVISVQADGFWSIRAGE